MPPPFGIGQDTGIGIGGMSVGECVKLRERQRLKERETQRLAAAETKAQREAAKAQASATGEGGWAQVAASRRSNSGINSARSVTPVAQGPSALSSSTMYAALAGDDGSGSWRTGPAGASSLKKEKLVLRSGVGAGKQLRSQPPPPAEVADNWEEEEEKEEQEERAREEDDPNDANDNLGQDDEQRSAPRPEADPEPAHGHEQKPDPAQEPLNEPGQATENIQQVLDASVEQLPHEPAPTHEPSTTTS